DFFLSETARHADVVFAGSLQEEDEGTVTTGEGRCVKLNQSVTPPGDAKQDWRIICELAERLGKKDYFDYTHTGQIFKELTRASSGGVNDYGGMTWDRIEREMGVFWPCPTENHPGTPRLFEDRKSYHPDGKFHMHPTPYRPSAEEPDDEYPIYYTSGRSVFHYLSGTQTRRIKLLVEKSLRPTCGLHPMLASELSLVDKQLVTVEPRRGKITVPLEITEAIRPDTVFVPYHWPERLAANQITVRALDPISKMPEFKVAACRVRAATKEEAAQVRIDYRDLRLQAEPHDTPAMANRGDDPR